MSKLLADNASLKIDSQEIKTKFRYSKTIQIIVTMNIMKDH